MDAIIGKPTTMGGEPSEPMAYIEPFVVARACSAGHASFVSKTSVSPGSGP